MIIHDAEKTTVCSSVSLIGGEWLVPFLFVGPHSTLPHDSVRETRT